MRRTHSFRNTWQLVRRSAIAAAIVSLAACVARSPQSGGSELAPTVPRRIHAEIRDSSVDALPDYRILVSPDLVLAVIDVGADEVVFRLRHRPGSFEPSLTRFTIDLDIDQNASTGSDGIEYHVFVFPAGGKGADVAQTRGANYIVIGTVPVSFVDDGCDVAIPRSLLSDEDGRFDFRVRVYAQPALSLVLDVLPDNGLVRIE